MPESSSPVVHDRVGTAERPTSEPLTARNAVGKAPGVPDELLERERLRWWWVAPPAGTAPDWEWAWYCYRTRATRLPANGNTERLEAIKAAVTAGS